MDILNERLVSPDAERHFLSGLCKYPEILYECSSVDETAFMNQFHGAIFSLIKQDILSGKPFDKVTLGLKVKSLYISFKDDIDPFSYIENFFLSQINKEAAISSGQHLVKLKVLRDCYNDTLEKQKFLLSSKPIELSLAEIVNHLDSIDNKRVNLISSGDEPVDVFAGIEQYIREIAENPQEESGYITPFSTYNKYFGGLQSGDGSYIFTGRMGDGKSIWMFSLTKGMSILNNCKVLYLDSEMSLKLNWDRAAAAQAGVNPWYLRNGQWIKNESMTEKVLKSFPEFTKYNGLFFHKYVPNKDIKEIVAIARKWYHKYVGRGNKAIIVMDYLKITSDAERMRNEWQQFGDKISILNELGSSLNVPIIAGAQQNRGARVDGGRIDDDTTIGGSDRIGQFARFAASFRKKTLDEISEHGINFGTHLLKPIKWSRDQGKEDYNQNSYVRIVDKNNKTKFQQNYINYEIKWFDIKEKGTLQDIVQHHNFQANLTQHHKPNDNGRIDI